MKKEPIRKIISLALIVGVMASCLADEVDLAGVWKLSGTEDTGKPIACPINVPGDVHAALFRGGLLPDPLYGRNEKKVA